MDRPNSEQQPSCEASTHNQGSPEEHTSLRRLPGALQRHRANPDWDLALCGLEILCLPKPQAALQTVIPSRLESCPAYCCIGRLSSDEVQGVTISGIYCVLGTPRRFQPLAAFQQTLGMLQMGGQGGQCAGRALAEAACASHARLWRLLRACCSDGHLPI